MITKAIVVSLLAIPLTACTTAPCDPPGFLLNCGGCGCHRESYPVTIAIVPGIAMDEEVAFRQAVDVINAYAGCPLYVWGSAGEARVTVIDGPVTGGNATYDHDSDGVLYDCLATIGRESYYKDKLNIAIHELLHCIGVEHSEGIMAPVIWWGSEMPASVPPYLRGLCNVR